MKQTRTGRPSTRRKAFQREDCEDSDSGLSSIVCLGNGCGIGNVDRRPDSPSDSSSSSLDSGDTIVLGCLPNPREEIKIEDPVEMTDPPTQVDVMQCMLETLSILQREITRNRSTSSNTGTNSARKQAIGLPKMRDDEEVYKYIKKFEVVMTRQAISGDDWLDYFIENVTPATCDSVMQLLQEDGCTYLEVR